MAAYRGVHRPVAVRSDQQSPVLLPAGAIRPQAGLVVQQRLPPFAGTETPALMTGHQILQTAGAGDPA